MLVVDNPDPGVGHEDDGVHGEDVGVAAPHPAHTLAANLQRIIFSLSRSVFPRMIYQKVFAKEHCYGYKFKALVQGLFKKGVIITPLSLLWEKL